MSGGFSGGQALCNGNSNGVDTVNTRGTAVVAAGSSYGSYTQIVSSTASDATFVVVFVSTNASANGGFGGSVKIALGGAGSEHDIIVDLPVSAPGSSYYSAGYGFPVAIPAGTRVSAAANGNPSADTFYVHLELYDGSYGMGDFAGVDSIGAANNGSRGTSVAAGAAATKGSYAQLIASTSRDYAAIGLGLAEAAASGIPNDRILVDIAIGGAGSEIIIIPDWYFGNSPTANDAGVNSVFCLPIQVTAGTRLSARIASSVGSNTFGLILYGLYE